MVTVFTLFAIWIYPPRADHSIEIAYYLLAGYLCYSFVLVFTAWRADPALLHYSHTIFTIDLSIFAVITFLLRGSTSPFFTFLVFCLATAALRRRRDILLTAAVAVGVELALLIFPGHPAGDFKIQINRFVYHSGYLLIISLLFLFLSTYERRRRKRIAGLAAWPKSAAEDASSVVSNILRYCASLLSAPRILLIWQEEEESSLHVACWSSGQFHQCMEPPQVFGSLVADPLKGKNFLCRDALNRQRMVLCSAPNGFEQWQGIPLHNELQRRFWITSVLSFDLQSDCVTGRLFVLDKDEMAADDLTFGKIISNEVSYNLDQFYLQKRLKQSAVVDERIRLARDLHDGLLQTLTGIAMQMEVVHNLLEQDPQVARQRLLEIRKLICAEQQNLRSYIQQLKPPYSSFPEWDGDLPQRLKDLGERIERQWELETGIDVNLHLSRIHWSTAQEVYFIIREAMINAARHAGASFIRAEIGFTDHQMRIVVADNGRGFSFTGHYEHAALAEANLGPVILRERVTSLGGQLAIDSNSAGARLEITLPIPEELS